MYLCVSEIVLPLSMTFLSDFRDSWTVCMFFFVFLRYLDSVYVLFF